MDPAFAIVVSVLATVVSGLFTILFPRPHPSDVIREHYRMVRYMKEQRRKAKGGPFAQAGVKPSHDGTKRCNP